MTNLGIMLISLSLFILSIYFYKKPIKLKFTVLFYFIIIFISFVLYITYVVSDYLSGNGIDDAVIYHLKYGLGGAGFSEYKGLITITITMLIVGLAFFLWFILKRNRKKGNHIISYSLLLLSLCLNPASLDLFKAFNADYSKADDFYKYYKKPQIKKISKNTKNLVFIYAESLEYTYFNEKIFPGLIKELRKLESKSITFTNIVQVPGNGYTIGGMVNSLLGLPLVTSSFGNSMSGMDLFLPSAIGLGDLLSQEGYHLAFYGGANLSFAGKGKFFKTHGFNEVLGKNELLPTLKDKNYLNGWGLYDDTLLEIVYNRFISLSDEKRKFGLFTLTLDTHHPEGQVSKSVKFNYKDGSNPILNAVAGSDYLISKFINKILNSPYADNTVIVLVSDHIALRNTAHELLTRKIRVRGKRIKIKRRNLFKIISSKQTNHEIVGIFGSNFDISPTLLPFIGYSGDIGLGRNLLLNYNRQKAPLKQYFRKNKAKFKIARSERQRILRRLKKWKGVVLKFWNFPRLKHSLFIDLKKNALLLDNRKFKIPVLIELTKNFATILKFNFNNNRSKTFETQLSLIDNKKYFLLIEKGQNLNFIYSKIDQNSFFLIAGKGKHIIKKIKLEANTSLNKKEIQQLLNIK